MVDISGLFYKRANVDLYFKNTSNNPPSLTYIKSTSSSFYPYLNSIFNTTKTDYSISSSSKNNSLISYIRDVEYNNQWNDLISIYDISQDSAINMNDNCLNLQNSIIKSGNLYHSFTEQSDSGIDITRSSNSSSIFISNKYSIPTPPSIISNKNVKFYISENSLFDNGISSCENSSNFPAKPDDFKSSSSYEKNNECNPCLSPMNNSTSSLKYRKNIHYVQNNTSKSKIKRYIKWRKTNSCPFIHKMTTLEKYKFMKTRSYPNILKHNEEQYSDTFLRNALGERNKHLSKSHTSFFSKINHFSFCPIFSDSKKDISTSSYYCPSEKTLFKKKYTSLSKSFPMSTKISNTKHNLQNTSIFDGKSNNVSSAPHDLKTECTDLKTQDKALLVVFIFFFFGRYKV